MTAWVEGLEEDEDEDEDEDEEEVGFNKDEEEVKEEEEDAKEEGGSREGGGRGMEECRGIPTSESLSRERRSVTGNQSREC